MRGERKRSTTPSPGQVCQGQRQATTHLQQNATQRTVQGERHHERRPVKQRDTLKQLRDDGWVAYYRGTRLITTRRQQAVRGPGRSAEPTGRRDHEDPMSTMQPSQEDRRDDWQREDWPGLSPSRQQQTSVADDSEAERGPSGDAETGTARSTPRSPGRGRGSPGSQRDDTGADEQHEGVAESSPVPAGGHRPRTRLQTHRGSDDRPMMSDGRQTQGRIDTMFQRHQHQ